MAYKVLSSLTANNINSADLLKVKTDLLIIAVNKKTSAAAELKGLQSITQSLVQESIKEINSGSRKSIFLPAPAKVAAKNILLIKEPDFINFAFTHKSFHCSNCLCMRHTMFLFQSRGWVCCGFICG